MVLYSSTKFHILKPWTNIQSLRRFDLDLYEAFKNIYRKLQYSQKPFEEFQGFSHFPRKMVLYSSTTFGILKPWPNTAWPRRFNFGFWHSSKQIYIGNSNITRKFQGWPGFPRKMVFISSVTFGNLKSWFNIPWPRKFDSGFWHTSKQIYR